MNHKYLEDCGFCAHIQDNLSNNLVDVISNGNDVASGVTPEQAKEIINYIQTLEQKVKDYIELHYWSSESPDCKKVENSEMNKHILLVMKFLNDPNSVTKEELMDNRKSAAAAYAAAAYAADAAYAAAAAAAADAADYEVKIYFEITKENRADYENKILETERERHIERLTRICRSSGYHCSDAFAGFLFDNGFRVD